MGHVWTSFGTCEERRCFESSIKRSLLACCFTVTFSYMSVGNTQLAPSHNELCLCCFLFTNTGTWLRIGKKSVTEVSASYRFTIIGTYNVFSSTFLSLVACLSMAHKLEEITYWAPCQDEWYSLTCCSLSLNPAGNYVNRLCVRTVHWLYINNSVNSLRTMVSMLLERTVCNW